MSCNFENHIKASGPVLCLYHETYLTQMFAETHVHWRLTFAFPYNIPVYLVPASVLLALQKPHNFLEAYFNLLKKISWSCQQS